MSEKRKIANWGNYPSIESNVLEADNLDALQSIINKNQDIIARGNGRSYGDASLNSTVFSTLQLNQIISFDEDKGIIECESGVMLSDILEKTIPKGYFLEVTPGTKYITVGGAIASDVHGKNHHHKGCFSSCLMDLKLLDENGSITTCSREENQDLFYHTIGGMGLSGIIISARFKLQPITTSFITYHNEVANDLKSLMSCFTRHQESPYSVAWIDCLSKGRGFFMSGRHADNHELPEKFRTTPLKAGFKSKFNIPFNFPSFALSRFTIKCFNFLYYHKQKIKKEKGITTLDKFFYPLDSINNWNRIYGKKGFIQYQCVFPLESSEQGLESILDLVKKHSTPPFLTVLKLMGDADPKAPWSFPMKGYTLAMDFKVHSSLPKLVQLMDQVVSKYGGRIYLAKDAMSGKDVIITPPSGKKFSSIQSKRLS